jgi:serine/threonine protein phosphatase PrpC
MQVIYRSVPCRGKVRNGDSAKLVDNDQILIGSVADGVGGLACDWKASAQVCDDLVYYFDNEYRELGISEGIAHSLRKTFARLYYEKGKCAGMLSTLVSIIIDKEHNSFHYLSIGDSKIIRFGADGSATELSKETEFKVPPDLLLNAVHSGGELMPGDCFALMTDGFWANRRGFEAELRLVMSGLDWEDRFEQIFSLYQLTQSDDMTLMLFKGE